MQVNILEAKSQLSRLIKVTQAGEEVVIANRGEPVARLVPLAGPAAATPSRGTAAPSGGLLGWLAANPLPSYLRRSGEEMDAAIDEERHAWD